MITAERDDGGQIADRSEPVTQSERMQSIDVLRGFALLGILMVNIQSFGLIDAKYMNPMAVGQLTGLSYWSWWLTYVFFDSKFMTIFSALFGAGMVLMCERAERTDRSPTGLHYRRMIWLMIFGLLHAYLLWYGDILFLYSICGMVVYWVCGWRPRYLIPLGLLLIAVATLNSLASGYSLPYWDEPQREELIRDWNPPPETIAEQLKIYRGTWMDQLPHRAENSMFMQTFLLAYWGFWRAGGLMIIGMGLYKLGFFSAERSLRFYIVGIVLGVMTGLSLTLLGVYRFDENNWSVEYSFFFGHQYNYWGSLGLSFAFACGIMLWCRQRTVEPLRAALAAVGQMALTNYLMHTILCTSIFYGHGLGWFGYLNRPQLIVMVMAIWLMQLVLSPIWLARFYYGPFEWLWRSLTYWKVQPFRRLNG